MRAGFSDKLLHGLMDDINGESETFFSHFFPGPAGNRILVGTHRDRPLFRTWNLKPRRLALAPSISQTAPLWIFSFENIFNLDSANFSVLTLASRFWVVISQDQSDLWFKFSGQVQRCIIIYILIPNHIFMLDLAFWFIPYRFAPQPRARGCYVSHA